MHIPKSVAETIINQLGLMPVLKQIGEARVVGSVALDVIVKPDIDIHIVVADLYAAIDQIYRYLLAQEKINQVKIKDFGDNKGILVGVNEFSAGEHVWSLDIWVTTDVQNTHFLKLDELLADMTAEHRKIIVKIKEDYMKNRGGTSNGISPKIYDAVVYNNINNLNSFQHLINPS